MSPGARIRMLRIILGRSREDFCTAHDINLNTLISIELDRLKISPKQMAKIIEAFCQEGLYVEESWIMDAVGTPPSRLTTPVENADGCFLERWASFFGHNRNAIITQVRTSAMEPFYVEGDLVGGLWHPSPQLLLGRRCIAQIDNVLHIGTLLLHNTNTVHLNMTHVQTPLPAHAMFSLAPTNTQVHHTHTIFAYNSARIAEILWHIRKHSHQIPELASLDNIME